MYQGEGVPLWEKALKRVVTAEDPWSRVMNHNNNKTTKIIKRKKALGRNHFNPMATIALSKQ